MSLLNQREKCRYCGTSASPGKCAMSPTGNHRFITVWNKCEFCLRNMYGSSCVYSDIRGRHKHGHGNDKCRWCGSSAIGKSGCPFSPHGAHER